jgi:hypothetical protein
MKTLFFIAALAGAVYLIMQTPAGQAWLEESEPELELQQETQHQIKPNNQKLEQVSTQVAHSPEDKTPENKALEDLEDKTLENKMSELAQHLNQKQQSQIEQLENRIAELENELILGRVTQKQQQPSVASGNVTLHSSNQSEQNFVAAVAAPTPQGFDIGTPTPDTLIAISYNQLQRKRQARLQDIAQKMEMSSLQALVN